MMQFYPFVNILINKYIIFIYFMLIIYLFLKETSRAVSAEMRIAYLLRVRMLLMDSWREGVILVNILRR